MSTKHFDIINDMETKEIVPQTAMLKAVKTQQGGNLSAVVCLILER